MFGANPWREPSLYIMMNHQRIGFVIVDLSLIPVAECVGVGLANISFLILEFLFL